MAKALIELVKQTFPGAVQATHSQHGDDTIIVDPGHWHPIAAFLKSSPPADMSMLMDLTAVDFPERDPRFEVVAHFYSLAKGHRLRMKARIGDPEGRHVHLASLADLWGSANWLERECWDLMGVVFDGHPDLRRILLYPEFEGHPLRKDYDADRIQPLVEYRKAPAVNKVPPFGKDEGMSFGRQTFDRLPSEDAPDPEIFPDKAN
ncbi:MAG TPA: NADH-quinone oxidoreductase subunit C [Polyangiaceae bacterium]|nr:NADH-quinone oxidoreductase subunit C [Polyangiaceae bacterium]